MDENRMGAGDLGEAQRIREAQAVELLRAACAEAGSARRWAEEYGLAPPYIYKVLRGAGRPGPKIAAALGLPRIPHHKYRKIKWDSFEDCYIPEPNSGCWLWKWSDHFFGYGELYNPATRKRVRAHRLSYLRAYGSIPDGMHVLHRCDNPRCVNPDHLFLGTQADNVRDMIQKGRARKARSPAPKAKLTAADVRAIRASSEPGVFLASRYGIKSSAVSAIQKRRTWRHIP